MPCTNKANLLNASIFLTTKPLYCNFENYTKKQFRNSKSYLWKVIMFGKLKRCDISTAFLMCFEKSDSKTDFCSVFFGLNWMINFVPKSQNNFLHRTELKSLFSAILRGSWDWLVTWQLASNCLLGLVKRWLRKAKYY